MKMSKKSLPTIIVIFGGTGDLAKRKLIPAFYNLFLDGWIQDQFAIIGLGRTELDDEKYRKRLYEGVTEFSRNGTPEDQKWEIFKSSIFYFQSDINRADAFKQLALRLEDIDKTWGLRTKRLFYLSVAPQFIETITTHLYNHGLASEPTLDHIIIEKPFGHNKDTAVKLNKML